MAQACTYRVVCPIAVQDAKYSTAHVRVARELLISCTGPTSSVSDGMVLDLSTDIKGTIEAASLAGFEASAVQILYGIHYSSASGSASTGVIKFVDHSTGGLTAGGTDLDAVTWRMRVLHS